MDKQTLAKQNPNSSLAEIQGRRPHWVSLLALDE